MKKINNDDTMNGSGGQYSEKKAAVKANANLKALIVDDVAVNRLITRQMIKDAFDCKEAENGEEAIRLFSDDQPDLILMDISMPVMNGVEALKQIRKMNPENKQVPIIAVTTGGILGNRVELLEEGFSEFIKKPVA